MRNVLPATAVVLVVWILASGAARPTAAAAGEDAAPYGVGYWKTHPGAWPVTELTLDGVTYDQAGLLQILNTPSRGDISYVLAQQLIAAMFNVYLGVEVCAEAAEAMDAAQAWLIANRVDGNPVGSAPTDPEELREAERVVPLLTAFNEGRICEGRIPPADG